MLSVYPCSIHGKRVPGRLGAAYPTVLRGSLRYSRKLRACDDCLTALLERKDLGLTLADDDDPDDTGNACSVCHTPSLFASELDAMFVTTYRRGEERQDFFARLCRACADNAVESLQLAI